jgi:EAL domain-containing protein (putative c-di-GMP-specific phosphodiesterase class I)
MTESSIMKNTDYSLQILKEINDDGSDLAVDDYGTGYSSLAYFKKLPVKWLKIGYTFIINMLEDEQDKIIVNLTINMAHNLGLGVVAEGVESQEILDKLTAIKCECTQVCHIGRPMTVDIFDDWFRESSKNKKLMHPP